MPDPLPSTTTVILTGDAALDAWNATGGGEEIAYLTFGSGKTIAAKVVSTEPDFDVEGQPTLEVQLHELKDRPQADA